MQGIFQKENTDKALKYGIYRHLPTYEKIIRNLVSFLTKQLTEYIRKYQTERGRLIKVTVFGDGEDIDDQIKKSSTNK